MSMKCEKCLEPTAVFDSRSGGSHDKNGIVYRRRKCANCGHRFTTYEISHEALTQLVEAQKRLQLMQEMFGQGLNGYGMPEKKLPRAKLLQHLK